MAGTRSSSRLSSQQKSSPTQPKESPQAAAGSKRKSETSSSPSAKRGRKTSTEKSQKTIEETMDVDQPDDAQENTAQNGKADEPEQKLESQDATTASPSKPDVQKSENDQNMKAEIPGPEPKKSEQQQSTNQNGVHKDFKPQPENADQSTNDNESKAIHDETSKMDDTGKIEPKEDSKDSQESNNKVDQSNNAVESHARDDETPSSILEKGVIYFFIRGRVGIDNPSDVGDVARSYIILRPIPHGAKIGDGTIGDGGGKCRLLALPKKVLPLSGKDRFMTFVEKSKTTFKELRDDFMSASDYATKTAGVQHTPPVTPVAEGVYALTTTGRESHLAYMITIPQELGEVQKDLGIREQGSYITSTKNPQFPGPANTNLPQSPEFPKEILDEFRSLRWAPLQPKYLDYENTQFLLIGESSGLEHATEQQPNDQKANKADPMEELEKLEGEDEIRVKNLKGDDSVFADLGISKNEYPQVPSTWTD